MRLFALLALLLACLAPNAPVAQEANVMNWRLGIPARPSVEPSPQAGTPASTYRARRRYDTPPARFPDDASLGLIMPELKVAASIPEDENRPRIGIVGDSLAEALALGLDADPGLKLDYALRQKTVSASGLVREDYHDWPKAFRGFLVENRGLSAVIVMVGLNDRQILRIGNEAYEPLGELWRLAYRARIDAMLAAADEADVPLIWVGLPAMRLPKLSQELAVLNDLIRERVLASRHAFVDTLDAFADAGGGFSMTGPDIMGDIVRLRAADGIHFTAAGQRKLAFFVERPLRRIVSERANPPRAAPSIEPPPSLATLPVFPQSGAPPAAEPPSEPAPAAIAPSGEFSLAIDPPAALAPVLTRQRPEAGEVRALNAPVLARRLVGAEAPRLADETSRALFERGLAPEPRRGRADDYVWR